jgi:hypothetical protein
MASESDHDRPLDELAAEVGELVDETEAMSAKLAREVGSQEDPGSPARESAFFKSEATSEDSLSAQFLHTDIAMQQTRQELGLEPRGTPSSPPTTEDQATTAPAEPRTAQVEPSTPQVEPAAAQDAPTASQAEAHEPVDRPSESAAVDPQAPDAVELPVVEVSVDPPEPVAAPKPKKLTKLALPPKQKAKSAEQPPATARQEVKAGRMAHLPTPATRRAVPRRKKRPASDEPSPSDAHQRRVLGVPVVRIVQWPPVRYALPVCRGIATASAYALDRICVLLEGIDRHTGWASPLCRHVCGLLTFAMLAAAVFLYLFGVR